MYPISTSDMKSRLLPVGFLTRMVLMRENGQLAPKQIIMTASKILKLSMLRSYLKCARSCA